MISMGYSPFGNLQEQYGAYLLSKLQDGEGIPVSLYIKRLPRGLDNEVYDPEARECNPRFGDEPEGEPESEAGILAKLNTVKSKVAPLKLKDSPPSPKKIHATKSSEKIMYSAHSLTALDGDYGSVYDHVTAKELYFRQGPVRG